MKYRAAFFFFLCVTWPVRFLPYRVIHQLGRILGSALYYLVPKFRKRALSNLALASDLHLDEKQLKTLAIASIQNLLITALEYAKFSSEKEIHSVATCENPEEAAQLMQSGKPVIFFCGHQANWEVLFLEGTRRMPGVAIGRPVKNKPLYDWVLRIREKYGGKIITPQNAIREGLRALKRGSFLGIVGDQGMPDSGYCSPFFGRMAWTSPIAAILSHRTGSPIIVATTRREEGKYKIHYSAPLWPNPDAPLEQEVDRLMRGALQILEDTIRKAPGEWLWTHNRWKQQTPEKLKRPFRHESILILLPLEGYEKILPLLPLFREIYPHEFITVHSPTRLNLEGFEVISSKDPYLPDYRFKLVFNFTKDKGLNRHFKKLAAFTAISCDEHFDLKKELLRAP
ncbi:MAG: hypothetical protein JSS61_01740 [Verrucomicrobia bacterium]|nr:hypothetical protein [Verrucomicrobiota bacterium]